MPDLKERRSIDRKKAAIECLRALFFIFYVLCLAALIGLARPMAAWEQKGPEAGVLFSGARLSAEANAHDR